jgi:Uma2 family endonuclease
VRAADAAVWREAPAADGFARTPPLLAVEVAGIDDTVQMLRDKSRWYLDHGVVTVWIVIPQSRSALSITSMGEVEVSSDAPMPEPAGLPELSPRVASFFHQLS